MHSHISIPKTELFFHTRKLSVPAVTVNPGAKIGLIGSNGAGKTRFLNYISETLAEQGKSIAYLTQQPEIKNTTIWQYIEKSQPQWWKVLDIIETNFGISLNRESAIYLPESQVNTLSGGELIILNIAICLSLNSDLILLDEPTNNLDVTRQQKLIKVLKEIDIPIIFASHDEYFLENIATEIWAIQDNKLQTFLSPYSDYLIQMEREQQAQIARQNKLRKQQKKLQESLKQQNLSAARRISQGSETNPSRGARAYFQNRSEKKIGSKRQSLEGQIANLDEQIIHKKTDRVGKLDFIPENLQNNHTLWRFSGMLSASDGKELRQIDYTIPRGQRILITGDNGSGKSTLAKKIFSEIESDSKLFVDQDFSLIIDKKSVWDNFASLTPGTPDDMRKQKLAKYGWKAYGKLQQKAETLSGGEKVLLFLAAVSLQRPEILILDEPTNHLDIRTKHVLQAALISYTGTLIVVSHDINFRENLEIGESWEL